MFTRGLTFHREGESCGIPFGHTGLIVKGKVKKEINSAVHFYFIVRSGLFVEFRTFHGEGKVASFRQTSWEFLIILKICGG